MIATEPGAESQPLAVVLSGGAALGAFQAGVIDALARAELVPELLVGTSIGALNAAFWAFNPGREVGAGMSATWRLAPAAHIFPRSPTSVALRLVEDYPIARPEHLSCFLHSIFGEHRSIEDAAVPLAIVSVDIVSGEPVVLRSGPLVPALMASAAIPGVYPPVEVDGRLLADGGVVANADLEVVVDAGIEDAVLVELMAPADRDELHGARELMEQAVTIALARQTQLEMRLLADRLRLAVIRLHLSHRPQPWDFGSVERLLELGRRAGGEVIASNLDGGRIRPGVIEPAAPPDLSYPRHPRDRGARPTVWSLGRTRRR